MITVLGVPNLLRRFAGMAAAGEVAGEAGRLVLSEEVVGIARVRVAVDTGAMRDSIQVTAEGVEVGEGIDDGRVLANEYGTSSMAAHPFMRPAADEASPVVAEQAMKRIVERA